MITQPIIRTENLHRIYPNGSVHAINNVSLEIPAHKITVVMGRSGAGKTTLLNLISGLDAPQEGQIWIEGRNLLNMSEKERLELRRDKIGFIFQNFGLLPLLSAAENVSIPLRMRKMNQHEREERIMTTLEWVGMKARSKHRPYELSGGEQQRVAIARALCTHPTIVLADEPTGQLDSQTGHSVLTVLQRLVAEHGITMVIVTHEPEIMEMADMIYKLHDGQLVEL